MALQPIALITPDEYLAWEREQEGQTRILDGRIVAMAGASFVHGIIVGNLLRALNVAGVTGV